jgi:formylglycine-generating enzyme required for sulfatase activity
LLSNIPNSLKKDKRRVEFFREQLSYSVPQRVVDLKTFFISRYPITAKQYYDRIRATRTLSDYEQRASNLGGHPALLTLDSAQEFCEGLGVRLPTSDEWEKAARGTDGRLYPWGNTWDANRGNFTRKESLKRWGAKTAPVTAYPSGQSPYGVMDMAGNAYEHVTGHMAALPTHVQIICRSCDADWDSAQDAYYPAWLRNLVTSISYGQEIVGLRPVMDTWLRTQWPGWSDSAKEG